MGWLDCILQFVLLVQFKNQIIYKKKNKILVALYSREWYLEFFIMASCSSIKDYLLVRRVTWISLAIGQNEFVLELVNQLKQQWSTITTISTTGTINGLSSQITTQKRQRNMTLEIKVLAWVLARGEGGSLPIYLHIQTCRLIGWFFELSNMTWKICIRICQWVVIGKQIIYEWVLSLIH
jgi:hypothetical protein